MVFLWSLSDSKSPKVSRILPSILAVLSNAVVWMVSTRPLTSMSSCPFCNSYCTKSTNYNWYICMSHSFFKSLARSKYWSFFSHSFSFILQLQSPAPSRFIAFLILQEGVSTYLSFRFLLFSLWSVGLAKSAIRQVLFSFRLSLDLVFWSWFGDLLVSENPIGFYASDSLGRIVPIPFGFMVKFQFLARFHADYLSHPVVSRIILFCINFHCYHSNLLFESLSLKYEWQQVSSSLELLSVFLPFSKML